MQGLEAPTPLPAAKAPNRNPLHATRSGSEFASEIEALEESAEEARSSEATNYAPPEVAPGDLTVVAGDGAEDVAPGMDEVEIADPEAGDEQAGTVPFADRVHAADDQNTLLLATGARGEPRPIPHPEAQGDPLPTEGAARGPDATTSKDTGAGRPDIHRPGSASEVALNAGLSASGKAGAERDALPAATAPRETAANAQSGEALPEIRAKSGDSPAKGTESAGTQALQTAPKRAILPERDAVRPAESGAKPAPEAQALSERDGNQSATQAQAAAMVPGESAMNPDLIEAELGFESERPADADLVGLGLASGGDPVGRPAGSGLSPALQAHGAGVAQQIANQIGAQIAQQSGGTTEIVLDPQELGRLSFSLSTQDGGITVAIAAERPETAELIRRHLDGLVQELRQIGYADVNVGFSDLAGQGSDADGTTGKGGPGGDAPDLAALDIPAVGPLGRPLPAGGGLDIRL